MDKIVNKKTEVSQVKNTPRVFVQTGRVVNVRPDTAVEVHEKLPPAAYVVKYDKDHSEFYLEQIEDFELPSRIYGKNKDYSRRILNTFLQRSGNTGVLLSGIKGAGKTLLAKQTAVAAREQGIPTIVINNDWHGDEFNAFIQSITTPSIILFDEFEKIYDHRSQRKILTLFDGVFCGRKLFMVTTNETDDVSEFLQNRPGRIYYNFKFDTLGEDFVREYLEVNLKDQSQTDSFLKYTEIFSFFNYDMLSACVEEMNRYGETLTEVLGVLNISPENRYIDTHTVEMEIDGERFIINNSLRGFQPNTFEYDVWTDQDMPREIQKNEEKAKILKTVAEFNQTSLSDPSSSSVISVEAHMPELLRFNINQMEEYDQVNKCFVYRIESQEHVVRLRVKRNEISHRDFFKMGAF